MVCRYALYLTIPIGLWFIFRINRLHHQSIPDTLDKAIEGLELQLKIKILLQTLILDVFALSPLFGTHKLRWLKHTLIFWGAIAIFLGALTSYFIGPEVSSTPPLNLLWMLNKGGMVAIIIGGLIALVRYLQVKNEVSGSYVDPAFLGVLCLAVGTGYLTTLYGSIEPELTLGFALYGAHLAFIAASVISMPFTRFIHAGAAPYLKFFERFRAELIKKGIPAEYKRSSMIDYTKDKFYPEFTAS